MSIIESIRDYMLTFPGLHEGDLCIDFLGAEPEQCSLEPVPCDPIYRKYTDGGALKQYLFVFASREYYSADVEQCAANQAFYEDFAAWVRSQNDAGNLPDLGAGKDAFLLEVLTSGYAFSEDAKTARYQIQLRLIYEEE
jgi:hypothetical protein